MFSDVFMMHSAAFMILRDAFMILRGKRLRVYTIVDFSFIRTFAPSF